ncbi:MAG TPA: FAD-dependent oxidoreductase [Euzebya sp.]|nr:FAD-dependent oxidoreductase [Euzebya sp.]
MSDHGAVSWWLRDVGAQRTRAALTGPADVDVAILGAGFTGLWTAYALQSLAPDLRVGVVEAQHVGYGASGRNGGWCTAGISVSWGELARRHGRDAARRTAHAMRDTLTAIAEDCAAEGIDAHLRASGILRIARGPHEVAAMETAWRTRVDLGLADGGALLDGAALRERVVVADAEGAVFDPHGATVHPGRLVTGLADVVERRGATIWEGTAVTDVVAGAAGRRPVLRTTGGDVTAATVVLAGEAFLAHLPGYRRRVLPLYSLIVLTEPLSQAQWQAIGWDAGECLSSHRHTVDYLARTQDGRILFGGRGAPYHYGSGIDPSFDAHQPTHDNLRTQLLGWFPALEGIAFDGAWGGAVGLSRDWLPSIHHDPVTGVAAAYGYGGQGVATAHLAGRVLAHRITGVPGDLDGLPLVGHRPRRWEPEPLRWLAVRYLQGALARLDERAAATGKPPSGRSLAERLTRH